MFGFLGPLLSGLFGGGAGAAVAGGLASAAVGLFSAKREARKAEKGAQAEQAEIKASEAKSQEAYRSALRGGSSAQGSGSFRPTGDVQPFAPSLKSLTGQ